VTICTTLAFDMSTSLLFQKLQALQCLLFLVVTHLMHTTSLYYVHQNKLPQHFHDLLLSLVSKHLKYRLSWNLRWQGALFGHYLD
jgi:hypothetical protein